MKKSRTKAKRRRGISRIDQPSTRTYGWFVRAGFYKRKDGTYAPRHRRFFGDRTHGGKRRALRAAEQYLAKIERAQRKIERTQRKIERTPRKKKTRTLRRAA